MVPLFVLSTLFLLQTWMEMGIRAVTHLINIFRNVLNYIDFCDKFNLDCS